MYQKILVDISRLGQIRLDKIRYVPYSLLMSFLIGTIYLFVP